MKNKRNKEENITRNIQSLNKDLKTLKQHFPNCFDKSGDFDFNKFKKQIQKNFYLSFFYKKG